MSAPSVVRYKETCLHTLWYVIRGDMPAPSVVHYKETCLHSLWYVIEEILMSLCGLYFSYGVVFYFSHGVVLYFS